MRIRLLIKKRADDNIFVIKMKMLFDVIEKVNLTSTIT